MFERDPKDQLPAALFFEPAQAAGSVGQTLTADDKTDPGSPGNFLLIAYDDGDVEMTKIEGRAPNNLLIDEDGDVEIHETELVEVEVERDESENRLDHERRETLPFPGLDNHLNQQPAQLSDSVPSVADGKSLEFRLLTPLSSLNGRSVGGPPATLSSAAAAVTQQQLPAAPVVDHDRRDSNIRQPEVLKRTIRRDEGEELLNTMRTHEPVSPGERIASPGETTEILKVQPPRPTLNPATDVRDRRRALAAVLAFAVLGFAAVVGVQMAATLSGSEARGPGGFIAVRIQNRPRPIAVVRVPHTQVVSQDPSPVPAQPPPQRPIVARCRSNGSFASEAEAVREGYTLVYLFPGQARSASTPVCQPE